MQCLAAIMWLGFFVVSFCATSSFAAEQTSGASGNASLQPSVKQDVAHARRWGYRVFFLVNEKNIRADLALTAAQKARIRQLVDDYIRDAEPLFKEKARAESPVSSAGAKPKSVTEKNNELVEHYGRLAIPVLTETQQKRLDQIAFQLCGLGVVLYPEVLDTLRLTDEQKAKLAGVDKWFRQEVSKSHSQLVGKQKDSAAFRHRLDAIELEARERLLAVLTADQGRVFCSMEGPRIPFAKRNVNLTIRKGDPDAQP